MPPTNRLANETSPYLLQHAHNPVDWFPWGEEAFGRARAENKPILLSIGYSACHWCHVMERESFESADIAGLMNKHFVSIKVDREERPDVDDVYMKAVQMLTGHGGWPLTVFLAPDGKPFYGGTYFPPTDRHGLPGFPRVLVAVAHAYQERPDEIAKSCGELTDGLGRLEVISPGEGTLDPALPERAAETLLRHVDWDHGGLGGAPKFPHASAFQLFLRRYRAGGNARLLEAVLQTAERMARGGVYDQVGGGFHRYAVDARWRVPHFEKMLYDNAQIPRLYLEAFQVTGEPMLRQIVEETLDYAVSGLQAPEGGFYSATDADSEGVEGRYFVWSRAEVASLVPEADLEMLCRHWDITEEGNFEGANILRVAMTLAEAAKLLGRPEAEATAARDAARARLLAAREGRVPPLRDEKVLAGWNGLMIGTLAEAGRVLRAPRFVTAAERAADFTWSVMRSDAGLLHVWTQGRAGCPGFLDDHAFLASAFLDLYEATGDRRHLAHARELVDALESRFRDAAGDGGYFFTAHDAERLIARSRPGTDGALPSGNSVAAHTLLRLHHLTDEATYRERAEEILHLFAAEAAKNPFAYVSYLEAFELWTEGPTEVIVVGGGAAKQAPFWEAVARSYVPHRILVSADGTADDPAPARGRPAVDGGPTAYVCRGFTCSAPVTDPVALGKLLAEERR